MCNNYDIKVQNHIKLDIDDIREFCMNQAKENGLDEYVTDFILQKVLFGVAGYDDNLHLVCLDTDFIKKYKIFKKGYQSNNIIDRFLVLDADVFNLFIMVTIYHEVHHAKQAKAINDNPDLPYANLMQISGLFIPKSGTVYNSYHHRFLMEYDAIISSLLFILEYTKDFAIDKRALFLLNRNWADKILTAYGVDFKEDTHSRYKSPIDFFRFFFDEKIYIAPGEEVIVEKLESSISRYKPDNDMESLLRGYSVPESFINKLQEIASSKVNSTNLLDDLNLLANLNSQRK